ncbi:hypothetical protein FIU97_14480 [Roseivivax sp. THAF40]|uniref:DUF3305 domain-containing protein n=1 Tax=unclassified Roseivivax TaxID=2639302 RepID=UPI0012A77F36|nr:MULTISPECIES: DUF3305 domain-containing protein [unclassified Roseivivax]QFS83953.1 hypothetical protein FIV09_14040 [Roseivivax sp. THAF197b]QFT47785.1 hypothetical protein FIU97_14480 [Roseivivax sp. THAF40]
MGESSISFTDRKAASIPVGVIVERRPGVTRWVREIWQPRALLPNAPPADWRVLREDGGRIEYHAATVPLTLYRGEAEAYRISLSEPVPAAYVIMRPSARDGFPWYVHLVTASPHEAALFEQSGDELVEKVALPDDLIGWAGRWIEAHYREERFVKRKRRRAEGPEAETPLGDPRIAKPTDIYRAPTERRHGGDT